MRTYTLITGATSGLGLATTKALAKSTTLILLGREQVKLDEVLKGIAGEHLSFCHDLTQTESLASALTDFMKAKNVLIDKVVHCAGIDQTLPGKSLKANDIDSVMRVNFYSIVDIINVLLKRSVNQAQLRNVLFVSSISAIRGYKAKGAYSASKAALDGYMRVLAKELAPAATVNSILPGAFPTPMSLSVFENPEMKTHLEDVYPRGIGSVEQVVDLIRCYHDMENLWMTGQQIVVDGGLTS